MRPSDVFISSLEKNSDSPRLFVIFILTLCGAVLYNEKQSNKGAVEKGGIYTPFSSSSFFPLEKTIFSLKKVKRRREKDEKYMVQWDNCINYN